MEFKEYLKILRQEKNIIIGSIIVLMIFATIATLEKPVSFASDLVLLISRKGTQATDNYKYDGYYAVQASDIFSDNISQWLASASIASEIYSRAGIKSDFTDFKNFSKVFKANKLSSQYVEVRYETKDEQSAKIIARAIRDVLQEKTDSLSKSSNEEISFNIIYNDPLVIKSENSIWRNNLLAVFGGLFLGVLLAFAKNYFK